MAAQNLVKKSQNYDLDTILKKVAGVPVVNPNPPTNNPFLIQGNAINPAALQRQQNQVEKMPMLNSTSFDTSSFAIQQPRAPSSVPTASNPVKTYGSTDNSQIPIEDRIFLKRSKNQALTDEELIYEHNKAKQNIQDNASTLSNTGYQAAIDAADKAAKDAETQKLTDTANVENTRTTAINSAQALADEKYFKQFQEADVAAKAAKDATANALVGRGEGRSSGAEIALAKVEQDNIAYKNLLEKAKQAEVALATAAANGDSKASLKQINDNIKNLQDSANKMKQDLLLKVAVLNQTNKTTSADAVNSLFTGQKDAQGSVVKNLAGANITTNADGDIVVPTSQKIALLAKQNNVDPNALMTAFQDRYGELQKANNALNPKPTGDVGQYLELARTLGIEPTLDGYNAFQKQANAKTGAGSTSDITNYEYGLTHPGFSASQDPLAQSESFLAKVPKDLRVDVRAIRSDYQTDPTIRNFQAIQEGKNYLDSIDVKNATSTDDEAIIYAFAKIMDANSAVREGEYLTVQKYAQALAEKFGLDTVRLLKNEKFLTDEAVTNMIKTANSRYKASERSYKDLRDSYIEKIDATGGVKGVGENYLQNYKTKASLNDPNAIYQQYSSSVQDPKEKKLIEFLNTQTNPDTGQPYTPVEKLQALGQDTSSFTNVGSDTHAAAPQKIADAIGEYESGGNYGAIGTKTKSGDYAYGKYQIMGANIPQWTKEVLGKSMTPNEFLNDAAAQDKVAQAKIAEKYNIYGNIEDVASSWFSGKPLAKAINRKDVNGTTVPDYVKKVKAIYNRI